MQADQRVEEAFELLHRPGGPTPDQRRRARELVREWLHDEEVAETATSDEDTEDGESWEDVPPPEVRRQENRGARAAGRPRR